MDAEDAIPGGLRLGRHRGEVAAEHAVEQRRLADVRQSDDRAEPGADLHHVPAFSPSRALRSWTRSNATTAVVSTKLAPRPRRSYPRSVVRSALACALFGLV